jgi:poly(3-hydroxybutyrate) depolymerase
MQMYPPPPFDLRPPPVDEARPKSFVPKLKSGKGLAATAYAYVPSSCTGGWGCDVHVVFHGCNQAYAKISDAYVSHAGYDEWAESNGVMILYPQTESS